MPAYYYIRSSGSATGDLGRFTSLQTGAFADASSYATLVAARAATTPPVEGDFYLFDDTGTITQPDNAFFTAADHGITCMSMDVNNRDAYKKGHIWDTSGDMDPAVSDTRIKVVGIEIQPGDDTDFSFSTSHNIWEDCIITLNDGVTDAMNFSGSHATIIFKDSDIKLNNQNNSGIQIQGSSRVIFDNCTNSFETRDPLVNAVGSRGWLTFLNTDLTTFITANGDIIEDALNGDDFLMLKLHRCKLPSGMGIFASTKAGGVGYEVDITSCDVGDGYHYFFFENIWGQVEEDLTQFLTASDAKYDGTVGFSAQIDTLALASQGEPFSYTIALFPAIDLATANQTVSIELTGPAGLTDTDVWIECVISNDTDEAKGDVVSSRNADFMAAGTALTSSSAVWETTTDTEYSIDLDLGAFTNVDNTVVKVIIYVSKPSITVNFDLPTIANT